MDFGQHLRSGIFDGLWPTRQGHFAIVDDEPINIKLGAEIFADWPATSRSLALQIRPPVMSRLYRRTAGRGSLDIMMPKVSGLEILEEIRRERRWAYLPVIIVTASDNEETKVQALELGATDFLGKPVNGTDLVPQPAPRLLVKAHHDYLLHYAKGTGTPDAAARSTDCPSQDRCIDRPGQSPRPG